MDLPEISKESIKAVLDHRPRMAVLENTLEAPADHPHIDEMLAVMEMTRFSASFDWQAEFENNEEMLADEEALQKADLDTLRKIMTAHYRIDRYDEGHLSRLILSGYWGKCLNRLQALYDSMD